MYRKLFKIAMLATGIAVSFSGFAQGPTLGSTANFVLFSSIGAVAHTGVSQLTGDIGTNNGSSTNFSNVQGSIHDQDGTSALAASDLLALYNQLNGTSSTPIVNTIMGNGQTLTSGAYHINSSASLNNTITLDGESNNNAVFIIKVKGAFSTNAGSQVLLINGAKSCNVYWQVEGAVNMAAGTTMRGSVVANNGAIYLNSGVTIDGRALTTSGAITVNNITGQASAACTTVVSSPEITTQPATQVVCKNSTANFNIVMNGGTYSYQWKRGNTNLVNGGNIAGAASANLQINNAGSTDMSSDYHVVMTGTAGSIDSKSVSLIVNSQPVIINQPLNTTGCPDYSSVSFSTGATGSGLTYQWRRGLVNLINGQNISGATSQKLTIYPMFIADTAGNYNVVITGICAPSVTSANASLKHCTNVGINKEEKNIGFSIFPNPFTGSLKVESVSEPVPGTVITIYNLLGASVLKINLISRTTSIDTGMWPKGIYFFEIVSADAVSSGKLISQ